MKRNIFILISFGVLYLFLFPPLKAQESVWPQFRGPNGCGLASEGAKPPLEFGEEINMQWKMDVPEGSSSPIIWKDRIFLTGCIENNGEMQLLCLDRNSGDIIWKESFLPDKIEGAHPVSNPAQSTPAVDEDGIYVYYASHGVLCYHHDGSLKWEYRIPPPSHGFGHASSLVVIQDKVIVNLDYGGKNSRCLLALNKNSGEVEWKTLTQEATNLKHNGGKGWSTPICFHSQIIIHRSGGIASYSVKDGSPIWWIPLITDGVSTPVVHDSLLIVGAWQELSDKENRGAFFEYEDFNKVLKDFDQNGDSLITINELTDDFMLFDRTEAADILYASRPVSDFFKRFDNNKNNSIDSLEWNAAFSMMSGFVQDLGVIAISLYNTGKLSWEQIIWNQNTKTPEVPCPVAFQDCIYTVKDGGWVTCMDANTGKVHYSEKLGASGAYFASPIKAYGYIYLASHRGIVNVIKATDYPIAISEVRLEGKILATPAIAGDNIYFRTSEYLYAFGETHSD